MKASTKYHLRPSRRLIFLALALLMSGCARSSPVTYYQLSAIDADRPAVPQVQSATRQSARSGTAAGTPGSSADRHPNRFQPFTTGR